MVLVHAGGFTRYGSFAKISMLPDIPYVRACIRSQEQSAQACGESLKPYTRFATADVQGRFIFTGVGPGHYLLRSDVSWDVSRGKLESIHVWRTAQADVVVDEGEESRDVRVVN